MTIYDPFLQETKLVRFSGGITYNANGYAVLPSYSLIPILASMQPISKASIKFLPEGTHYGDFLNFYTDYPVQVDTTLTSLGDYFIYKNNYVYKIFSSQNFLPFTKLFTNHIEGMICRDNRITFNGTTLNIPFPEIDSQYAPLYELIAMVNSCFTAPTITTLWGFQQELQPTFPYCMVTLEAVENMDNTNYINIDINNTTLTTNTSKQLVASFNFYAFDQVQCISAMEQFKLRFQSYTFSTELLQFIGFVEEHNFIEKEFYEDRTVFHGTVKLRFSWIVQETETSTMTINTAAATLSFST